jgi:hypothetical protein
MSPVSAVSKEIVAHDFTVATHGKLDEDKIDAAVKSLSTTTTSYPCTGSVASLIFYLKFQITITPAGGKVFNGNAGGVSSPGGGALFGDVYTDDLNRLYSNTVSFEFQGTPVYLSILFFDGNSNLLGHAQCGAVSTVLGVGGGTGSWS